MNMKTINAAGWANTPIAPVGGSVYNEKESGKSGQVKNGAFFGGNINNFNQDKIGQKREQSRNQAAKIIMDQFDRDKEISNGMDELRDRNKQIREEISCLQENRKYFEDQQTALKDKYGVTDDSQEQQDLELIQKANQAVNKGTLGDLSKEELERIANMGELTEYQQRALVYDDIMERFDKEIEKLVNERTGNTLGIVATKNESVKNTAMMKASDAAQNLLYAASDSIIGMILEDAVKHIEEEMEELVEAAREEAEKKEALEEQIDKAKEEDSEQKELVEAIQENTSEQKKLQGEIDKIMKEAELLAEEMKGLIVDKAL